MHADACRNVLAVTVPFGFTMWHYAAELKLGSLTQAEA